MEKSDCVGKLISQGHHSDIIQDMHRDTRSDIAITTVIINSFLQVTPFLHSTPCMYLTFYFRGMDPIVFAALCGVGTGIVGFMLGGALFNATWKLLARKAAREMQEVGRGRFYEVLHV